MAAMAKCPSDFNCGSEFIFLEGHETLTFNISKVHKNGLCIYNIFTDPDEGLQKYSFWVDKESPESFLGGVYSNNNVETEWAISGQLVLNSELTNEVTSVEI